MKLIKKGLIIVVAVLMVVCLSGCEEGNNNTTDNKTNSTSTSNNTTNSAKKKSAIAEDNIDVNTFDFLASAEKQVANPEKGETIAIMHIKNYGDIKIKFFKDKAPKAVENFIAHAKDGYYNGTTFHRVINDFMIQGGDPTATGYGGESIWGTKFEDEFSYYLLPYRGALCMANSGTNTNGSQFFIEQAGPEDTITEALKSAGNPDSLIEAYKKYGGSMHLIFKHTVFGQVFEGMDIVDKIAAVQTDENNKPIEDVIIESIEILEY